MSDEDREAREDGRQLAHRLNEQARQREQRRAG